MLNHRNVIGASVLALLLSSAAFAETAPAKPAPAATTDTTTTAPAATTDTTKTAPAATTNTAPAATTDATTTAPAATTDTTMATGTAPADCEAQFKALDTDANNMLSEVEAPQIYARARVANQTVAAGGYTKDDYLKTCGNNEYTHKAADAGAPLAGANSFTEGQAKDRATAWGVTGVSSLTKDDKGVWRGTGMIDGASVGVAVDYKGNVVTAAQ